MKQVVQDLQKKEILLLDVPVPKPNAGMALVKTRASLVSTGTERSLLKFGEKNLLGKARARPDLVRQTLDKAKRDGVVSTMKAVRYRLDQSMPLGYSSAGIIVELGEGLREFSVGDRVACAGGGYAVHAEYGVIPMNLMARLPEDVSFEEGAFGTLGAIALHGYRLAHLQIGEHVAIIGLGLIGLLTAQIAKAGGCRVLGVDLDQHRVELARELGIRALLRNEAEELANRSQGVGHDAVIICADTSSHDPVTFAGVLARDRGRIISVGDVGMQIPRDLYFEKELSFLVSRSYGPGRYDPAYEEKGVDYPIGYVRWTEGRNLSAFLDLVDTGKVKVEPLISHRFEIERAAEAYEAIAGHANQPFVGVVIQYPTDDEHVFEHRKITLAQVRVAADEIRLGVLGAGNFAKAVMLPMLKRFKSVELSGIAAASGLNARAAGDRYGFQFATTDENVIIDDDSINTLMILTRHHLHAAQVIAGLNANKNVFCEKPLALNHQQVEDIIKVLHTSDKLLMVGFNRRFAPLAVKLNHFLNDIQSPLMLHYRVNAGILPVSHWTLDEAQGGGRIIGEGCHFIDFMIFLTGSLPISVRTEGLGADDASPDENVTITLQFADGSLGTIVYTARGDRSFSKERLEVFAAGRVAVLDDFKTLEMVSQGKRVLKRTRGAQDKGHRAEWKAFIAAIEQGGPPPIPYEQLLAATTASFAALESLHSRQTVVLNTSTQN